jgi:hypothetical protein
MTTTGFMRVSAAIPLMLTVVFLCPLTSGKTIFVDDDAIGNNDGTSWENAYAYLQDALADSNSAEKPVEIRVAQGIYKPKLETGTRLPGNRITVSYLLRFQLINGVTLLGGYAGLTEPEPDIRNIENYETILSGDLNGDDIDVINPSDLLHEPTRSDNCSSIVIGSGTNRTAVLDGFIITGGFVKRHPAVIDAPTGRAGGMKNESGSPTINNCTFIGNSAESCGGGMLINAGSDPILTNCKFIKNYAGRGGGVDSGNSTPTFINCTFTNNYADDGAGMSVYYSETTQAIPIEFIDCTFEYNNANNSGGGLKIYSGDLVLMNCVFIGNSASKGGGMYSSSSNTILTYCQFISNSASASGGGLSNREDCNLTMTNCLIVGNWAEDYGAGIMNYNESNSILKNCIFWDNTNLWDNEYSQIGGSSNVSYSNIQGGWEGEGNIDKDPLFADPGYWADADDPNIVADPNDPNAVWIDGDYHLKSQAGMWDPVSESWAVDDVTSPCIDAGDPKSPIGHEPFPNGGIINMGAYGGTVEASKSYFGKPVCETIIAGDINGDCKVDFDDLMILMNHWLVDYTPQD